MPDRIRIATYNIHSGVGMDAVFNIDRIIRVMQEFKPDIVAIQEASVDPAVCGDTDTISALRREFGPHICAASTLIGSKEGHFGNLLLSKYPLVKARTIDLGPSLGRPRNAIEALVRIGKEHLRIIATHMSLKSRERWDQIQKIIQVLDQDKATPTVLLGDINEWRKGSAILKSIETHVYSPNAPTSFLSKLPVFALDRIWGRPGEMFISQLAAHKSFLARQASDHLPVYADISLSGSPYAQGWN